MTSLRSGVLQPVDTTTKLRGPSPPKFLQGALPRFQEDHGYGLSFTGDLPEIEDLATTTSYTGRQYSAERGAITERQGNLQKFSAQGRLQEYLDFEKEQTEEGFLATFTNPVFDVLGIFTYPQAGAAREFARTGSGWSAFKQAASEFANVLPGIDEEMVVSMGLPMPERSTYADVLREMKIFDSEGHGRWGSAVGGLMLDILTDPFTYTGYGTIVNAAKGLNKYKAIAKGVQKLERGGAYLRKIEKVDRAIDSLTRKFITKGGVKSLDRRLQKGDISFSGLERDPYGASDTAGEVIGALRGGGKESAAQALKNIEEFEGAIPQGKKRVEALVKGLIGQSDESELMLIGAYMQVPEVFNNQLKEVASKGLVRTEDVPGILAKRDEFAEAYFKYYKGEVARGVINEGSLQANYMSGIQPITKGSKQFNKDIRAKAGIQGVVKEEAKYGSQLFQNAEHPGFTMPSKFKTVLDAMHGGYAREVNVGVNLLDRGFKHEQAMAWADFMDNTLNNPAIAHKITTKLTKGAENDFRALGYDIFHRKIFGDEVSYLMPKEIVGEINHMQKVWSDPDEMQDLFKAFDWFNSTWKGWATMSPGFHFRNNFSNWYLNWMGDVGNVEDDYSNVPMFLRRAAYKIMGKEAPKVAGMMQLAAASHHVGLAIRLEDVPEQTMKHILKSFGAKNIAELKTAMPKIVGRDGKVLDAQGFIDEMRSVDVLDTGMFGDLAEELQQKIHQNSFTKQKYIEKDADPLFDAVETRLDKGATLWEYNQDGQNLGRVRLQGNRIRDISADSPDMAKQFLADVLMKKTNRLPVATQKQPVEIYEGLGGLTKDDLLALGFESTEGVDYAGKALMRWNEEADEGLNALTRQMFVKRETNKALDFAKREIGPHNTLSKYNRAFGGLVENHAKIMHYMDRRVKGLSPEDAAISTKKWLYDYGELTDFERKFMKRILPFYSWMKNNSFNMARSIVMNPGKFARTSKFIEAIESLSPEWEDIQTPDYYDELKAIRLPWARKGKPVYLNPNLPFQDINRLNWKDAVSSLNPLIKGAFESVPEGGYNIFMDMPIEKYEGEPSQSPIFKKLGLSKTQEHRLKSVLPPLSKLARISEKYEQGELLEQIATEFGGVKLIPYDRRRHTRGLTFAWRQASRDYKQKLSDE